MAIVRTITLEMHDQNDWTVREGDNYTPPLCWDEMLGTVAELTHLKIGASRYRMRPTEEHVKEHERHEERMRQLAAREPQWT